jgi:hypothetical protein
MPADLLEGARGKPSGGAHPLDGLLLLDVWLACPGAFPADIFWPCDVRWHVPHRGQPAGLEQCRHDLEV